MAKKTSKKKSPPKIESVIYSKIEYEDANSAKRNILEMQASLLGMMQNIEAYKELRKRELMWKIKLKNNFKEIKDSIGEIMKEVPKTAGLETIEQEHKERKKKNLRTTTGMGIEVELANIQEQLEQMNK